MPLLTLLAGCLDPTEPQLPVRDLARCAPELLLEEPSVLRAEGAHRWVDASPRGWLQEVRRRDDGAPFLLASAPAPAFELVATGPGERTIELEAWLPKARRESGRSETVSTRFNGQDAGEVTLTHLPSRVRLVPPAESWRVGRNELVLELGQESRRRTREGTWSLAVSEVVYGRGGVVERLTGRDGWRLAPGAGLRHTFEPLEATQLRIGGTAAAAGRLDVRFVLRDPARTDRVRGVSEHLVDVAAGEFLEGLPLPATAGEVVSLDLLWRCTTDASVDVERLELLEPPGARARPSVVLISIDTLSAHHTSLYGYPRATTPQLERFAADAFVFRRCAANAPWTASSFAALFSGMYPTSASMKLVEESSRFHFELPATRWALPEALRGAGYRTAAFVDVIWLEERFGFAQGFDHFDESASHVPHAVPTGGLEHVRPRGLDWLRGVPADEPFFLFLHAYDVHGPYLPAEPWAGRFADDGLGAACEVYVGGRSTYRTLAKSQFQHAGLERPERVDGAPFVAAYDEEILALDAGLGELFDALEATGALERAWVVFTADHGEATCDHDFFGHGLLYEDTIQVPLVVRPPGGTGAGEPTWIDASVQLVDVYPTLLELAGVEARRPHFHGRSLAPALRGERLAAMPTYSEGGVLRQAAVEHAGWKLIEMHPREDSLPWTMLSSPHLPAGWLAEHAPALVGTPPSKEALARLSPDEAVVRAFLEELRAALPETVVELYHLDADPGETEDLSARHPEKVRELLALLRECQARREPPAEDTGAAPLTDEDLKRLGALGYVDPEEE